MSFMDMAVSARMLQVKVTNEQNVGTGPKFCIL